jgi:hypothetical protein
VNNDNNGNNGTNGNGNRGVLGSVTKLGSGIIQALPSGFLSLVLLIAFMLWIIRDIQTERIDAMREFAVACTKALQSSQPGK